MTKQQAAPSPVSFKTTLFQIDTWTIIRLPKSASEKLSSRGLVMANATINGIRFLAPLEPDGEWSHWCRIDDTLLTAIHAAPSDTVEVDMVPISVKDWPDPKVPADLMKAIKANDKTYGLWQQITPMARWEWVRWTRSTNHAETRQKRIAVTCSKLRAGIRRPCCWNRNLCTEPRVSKSGVLLTPAPPVS